MACVHSNGAIKRCPSGEIFPGSVLDLIFDITSKIRIHLVHKCPIVEIEFLSWVGCHFSDASHWTLHHASLNVHISSEQDLIFWMVLLVAREIVRPLVLCRGEARIGCRVEDEQDQGRGQGCQVEPRCHRGLVLVRFPGLVLVNARVGEICGGQCCNNCLRLRA